MTDITERLRRLYVQDGTNYVQEAADLIDKLRAERDHAVEQAAQNADEVLRLREVLEKISWSNRSAWQADRARAVLEQK